MTMSRATADELLDERVQFVANQMRVGAGSLRASSISAIAQLENLLARDQEAFYDPGWDSRLLWRRRRAGRTMGEASARLRAFVLAHSDDVIDEAIEAASRQHTPGLVWQRVDHRQVLEELPEGFNVCAEQIVERIYLEARARIDDADVRLLEDHAMHMPAPVYERAAGLPLGVSKPRQRGLAAAAWLADAQSDLRDLYRLHAELPSAVRLWRGEHAIDRFPDLAEQMQQCVPGDVIERGSCVLSCTTDPAIAANLEFSGGKLFKANRKATDGWVLRIRSEHAIYIGSREKLTESPDGLVHEREALLFAPQLMVEQHHEMLVDGTRGLQRIHVIDCTAPPLGDVSG